MKLRTSSPPSRDRKRPKVLENLRRGKDCAESEAMHQGESSRRLPGDRGACEKQTTTQGSE